MKYAIVVNERGAPAQNSTNDDLSSLSKVSEMIEEQYKD